jgi:hypothetical protein
MKLEEMEEMVFGCCGTVVWLPRDFLDDKRKTGRSFYCPNGHVRVYKETTANRLQRELEITKKKLESQDSTISSLKSGKCPFCWKTVKDLSGHISRCH